MDSLRASTNAPYWTETYEEGPMGKFLAGAIYVTLREICGEIIYALG